jgi:hypothetical protein
MATLEIYDRYDQRGMPVALTGEQFRIGRGPENDLVIEGDDTVSNDHLLLRSIAKRWDVRDLGAKNPTKLNGKRLTQETILNDGDQLIIGRTRLVFLSPERGRHKTTEVIDAPPSITRREHDVLVELCLPRLDGSAFTPPASAKRISERLYVTRAAVANHLGQLYRKFNIPPGEYRSVELANAAMDRGSVTMDDLREAAKRDEQGD